MLLRARPLAAAPPSLPPLVLGATKADRLLP
jgi:hypothetical protein